MLLQVVQVVCALGIVGAFTVLQLGIVGPHDRRYLVANLVSAGGLTAVAVATLQPGFIISNGFWALVAGAGLVALLRRSRATGEARR